MKAVKTELAPQPIGGYSQAIAAGPFVFCSGQIPLDPVTGQLVVGTFADQVKRVLKNIQAVLFAADLDLNDVVKTTVYLTDLSNFSTVNELYKTSFQQPFPARAVVQVNALPAGAEIEIEALAWSGDRRKSA